MNLVVYAAKCLLRSALTLPWRPSLIAFAIRICSRCTSASVTFQLMKAQLIDVEDAPVSDVAAAVICLSSCYRFSKFSRAKRPVRRGRTFVLDDVSINILTITVRHSLLLTSCACITTSVSYDALSLFGKREPYGVATFHFTNRMG